MQEDVSRGLSPSFLLTASDAFGYDQGFVEPRRSRATEYISLAIRSASPS